MPKPKSAAPALGKPISIRLPPDEESYYRQQAAAHRMPLNAFITKTLVQGVTAENMLEFEERMTKLLGSIPAEVKGSGGGVPDDLALSLFTCEALLTAIVEAQDSQTLYAAQDAAKARMRKRKGA